MTQYGPKSGAISINSVVALHLKGVEEQTTVSTIEEYDVDGGNPDVLEPDQIRHRLTVQEGWPGDAVSITLITAGTGFTTIVYPRGNSTGMARATYSNCYLVNWRRTTRRSQVILVDLEIVAKSVAHDTVPA